MRAILPYIFFLSKCQGTLSHFCSLLHTKFGVKFSCNQLTLAMFLKPNTQYYKTLSLYIVTPEPAQRISSPIYSYICQRDPYT